MQIRFNAALSEYEISTFKDLLNIKGYSIPHTYIMEKAIKNTKVFLSMIANMDDLLWLAYSYPENAKAMMAAFLTADSKDFTRILGHRGIEQLDKDFPEVKMMALNRLNKNSEEYHRVFSTFTSNKSAFFKKKVECEQIPKKTVKKINAEIAMKVPQDNDILIYHHDIAFKYRRNSVANDKFKSSHADNATVKRRISI